MSSSSVFLSAKDRLARAEKRVVVRRRKGEKGRERERVLGGTLLFHRVFRQLTRRRASEGR